MSNYIFDLDGTLINSYPSIGERLHRLFLNHNINISIDEIIDICLKHNTYYLIKEVGKAHNLEFDELKKELDSMKENIELITLIPNCDETLYALTSNNNKCFIYTHRGVTTKQICKNLNIEKYFTEIIDSSYNFERKPSSEAIDYLANKYSLDKHDTYYVGDRQIDIECGINSGIKTIFLINKSMELDHDLADYVIDDLKEIIEK